MINSTSKTEPLPRTEAIGGKTPATSGSVQRSLETDSLSAANRETLQTALQQQPEVRPDVVERGQKLAVAGNYPPLEIIRQLSKLLLSSTDLSEEN